MVWKNEPTAGKNTTGQMIFQEKQEKDEKKK